MCCMEKEQVDVFSGPYIKRATGLDLLELSFEQPTVPRCMPMNQITVT
jgi:hypothetical protein